MTTCLTELFIWSLKDNVVIPNHVIGCHSYHDKGDQVSQQYHEEKQQFVESRGMVWAPKNKRPEKLRDSIKEMEELLSAFKLVLYRWRSRKVLQMVLSNGAVINVVLSPHSGDIDRLLVDKSLVGKFSSEMISDAILTDQFMVVTFPDKPRVDYIYFCKRPPLGDAIKKLEKLSAWEPKITTLDIPGPVGRRLERTLSVNTHQDMVLIWWRNSSEEAAMPWSPMATAKDRANMVILSIHSPIVDVLAFTRTECDPQFAGFSQLQPHKIYTVEQALSSAGETSAKACTYEVVQGKIQRTSVVNIALKSYMYCHCRSPSEDKLLIGCADGTLVMYDDHKQLTQMTRAAIIPSLAAWHPTGTIFFVGSVRGDIQVFDMALSPIWIQLLAEEPAPHRQLQTSRCFKSPPALRSMEWCPFDPQAADWSGDYTDGLGLVFDRGPAAMLLLSLGVVSRERISCVELVTDYIRQKQTDEAVALLVSMSWDTDGQSCYTCLTAIVTHLLKCTLNADREVQLETALGSFYAPKRPLSEMTILDYRDPISRLARRFFHHLLRYARFDKAFLLAVDIGARDLFMDIHYMALDKGETALAEVARRKAEQVDSESVDSYDDDVGAENNFYQQQNIVSHQRRGLDRLQNGVHQRQGSDHAQEIPTSMQHPWHQDVEEPSPKQPPRSRSHQQPQGHRSSQRSIHDSSSTLEISSERQSRQSRHSQHEDVSASLDGLDLDSDFLSDYTSALNDGTDVHADGKTESVNVIHFGVV